MEDTLQTWGRPQSSPNGSGEMSGLLFVGGLPLHACDQNLTRYFRRFGPLDSAEVQRRSTGRSKGYAFIQFVRPADALKVLQRQHSILGQAITVTVAKRSLGEDPKMIWNPRSSRRVFVHNIPLHLQQYQLVGYLSRYVQVEHVSLLRTQIGEAAEQICYVIPKTLKDSQRLLNMEEIEIDGGFVLKFKLPVSKFDRIGKNDKISNQVGSDACLASKKSDSLGKQTKKANNQVGTSFESKQSDQTGTYKLSSSRAQNKQTLGVIYLRKGLWIATPDTEFSSASEANYCYRIFGQSRSQQKVEVL